MAGDKSTKMKMRKMMKENNLEMMARLIQSKRRARKSPLSKKVGKEESRETKDTSPRLWAISAPRRT